MRFPPWLKRDGAVAGSGEHSGGSALGVPPGVSARRGSGCVCRLLRSRHTLLRDHPEPLQNDAVIPLLHYVQMSSRAVHEGGTASDSLFRRLFKGSYPGEMGRISMFAIQVSLTFKFQCSVPLRSVLWGTGMVCSSMATSFSC